MVKYVYDFCEGSKEMLDLLGGKGANLAEMTNLGLPVPSGFTITTDACQTFLTTGSAPPGLHHEISEHLARLEREMGKKLGDPIDPLLVSVRSGAKFSMPGMMDTVLDVGLNDSSVEGLAKQSNDERFAWDSYRRLVQMFSKTVLGVDGEPVRASPFGAEGRKGGRDRPGARRRGSPDSWSQFTKASSRKKRAIGSPSRPVTSWTRPSWPFSTRGTESGRAFTAGKNVYPTTWGQRSRWWRWSSATSTSAPVPGWPSPVTRPQVTGEYMGTTCKTLRAKMSWRGSAIRCRSRSWRS